jgi:hypothetical protein
MVATWIFFAKAPMYPLIGHFLWVGGTLVMLSPEAFALFKGRAGPALDMEKGT